MMQAERRIRSLKIRGPDAGMLRARYLLEEAFRLASLPGLPLNALVLVRRLDLGRIQTNLSPERLAGAISEIFHSQMTAAVCIDQPSAIDANMVWFSDPLRPYQLLLQRLLDGKVASEWYWAVLFPGQRLSLNEYVVSDLMIQACHRLPIQGLAISLLIQACLEPARLLRLFPVVTPAMVRHLLHAQGMTPTVLAEVSTHYPGRQETINPEVGIERQLDAPSLNQAWRDAVFAAVAHWGRNDIRTRWLALQALLCYRPIYLESRDTWQRIEVERWIEAWSASTFAEKHEQIKNYGLRTQDRRIPKRSAFDDIPGKAQNLSSTENAIESFKVTLRSPPGDFINIDRPSCNHAQHEQGHVGSADETLLVKPAQFSLDAGFALLIPLLQRIGMADLLQRYDVLLELDFPRQLLWAIASRFKLNETDPVWGLFDQIEKISNASIDHFTAPPEWLRLFEAVPSRYFPMPASKQRLAQLLADFQLVAGIYLRRRCALSLRALIHRPGRVALSNTHWDVMFDINQTDLSLRRMALDSDPGWVPWLGKVVRFHYVSEGHSHG